MHIMSIVGARPQFVKLAPIAREFEKHPNVRHSVIHTGQHYDPQMSAVFFDELELPKPDRDLGVGSASHAIQTGSLMQELEACFIETSPDVVLVYGDTNSTLAACLAASKLQVPTAHIEAGLRSFNREMPEEINRIVSDHCCDRLYVPSPAGMKNLADENLTSRAVFTGDVMRDVVEHNRKLAASKSQILSKLSLNESEFALLTLHRPVNTTPEALVPLLKTLDLLAQQYMPIVFPVHPRTRAVLRGCNVKFSSALRFIEPLAYLDMLKAVESTHLVLTDSGGLQKEAAFLKTQCITLREETEWVETVDIGVNCIVGQDPDKIANAFQRAISNPVKFDSLVMQQIEKCFGDCDAAGVIVKDIISSFTPRYESAVKSSSDSVRIPTGNSQAMDSTIIH